MAGVSTSRGGIVRTLAYEGGIESTLWAGPESISHSMRSGQHEVQGTRRRGPVSLRMGFAADELGYLIDLGMPIPDPGLSADGGPLPPSLFNQDPAIKQEIIFTGTHVRGNNVLVERKAQHMRFRNRDHQWESAPRTLASFDSILTDLAGHEASEIIGIGRTLSSWRFYDHFRTDPEAPARKPHLATRTRVLSSDGHDLGSALQTIRETAATDPLGNAITSAFPGSQLELTLQDGRIQVALKQPGMLRPIAAHELSDGTLRYLLLVAALLSQEPPELMILNEPETSLHQDLIPALAELIVDANQESQIVVVSHSHALVSALEKAGATRHELIRDMGETKIEGQLPLEAPPWHWPKR